MIGFLLKCGSLVKNGFLAHYGPLFMIGFLINHGSLAQYELFLSIGSLLVLGFLFRNGSLNGVELSDYSWLADDIRVPGLLWLANFVWHTLTLWHTLARRITIPTMVSLTVVVYFILLASLTTMDYCNCAARYWAKVFLTDHGSLDDSGLTLRRWPAS